MGRQTAMVATEEDERQLLGFIRSTSVIRILSGVAQTEEELWISDFPPYDPFHSLYYVWNLSFSWKPDIRPASEKRDCVVVWDTATAPIIEFSRTDCVSVFCPDNQYLVVGGRLYWCKHHMSKRLAYDVAKFSQWHDRIIRWVRKYGKKDPAIAGSPYLLPDAWHRWRELREERIERIPRQ